MIKKYAINKFVIATLCLVLFMIFYFFPTTENIKTEVIKENKSNYENVVYLIDNDNYVSRVICYYDKLSIVEDIKKKIDLITNYDLDGFYTIIPKGTVLKDVKVDKDSVYLDFSKDLLNINAYFEEEMIEGIVFTLTEINGINNIYISVEGEELKYLPNSKKELNYPLTRNIGINKEYNLNNFNNINKTTVYFSKKYDDISYYVPVTKVMNSESEKIDIIIEELKSSVNSQNNFKSYISDNLELVNYTHDESKMSLVFNNYIFNDFDSKNVLEEVKYIIASSVFENYNVNEVVFNTESEENIADILKK